MPTLPPIEVDEHGILHRDGSRPAFVQTAAEARRWDLCMGIAEYLAPPGTSMRGAIASSMYRSNIATEAVEIGPDGRPREPETVEEALFGGVRPDAAVLRKIAAKRKRSREGQFAEEPGAPKAPKTRSGKKRAPAAGPEPRPLAPPPKSPGTGRKQMWTETAIKELGLNDWPDPSPRARELLKARDEDARPNTAKLHKADVPASGGWTAAENVRMAYTSERRELHDKAVGRFLAGISEDPKKPHRGVAALLGPKNPLTQKLARGEQLTSRERSLVRRAASAQRQGAPPKALFLAGGPASGKSTVLRTNPDLVPAASVEVNADDFKEQLPEYKELRDVGDRYAASAVHLESGDLAARLTHEAVDLGLNTVVDGTGNSRDGAFAEEVDRKKRSGYAVSVVYVNADTDEAITRMVLRAQEEGRFVPVPVVRESHARVSRVFNNEISKMLDKFESFEIFDQAGHIATKKPDGTLHEFDKERMDAFRAKADVLPDVDVEMPEAPMSPGATAEKVSRMRELADTMRGGKPEVNNKVHEFIDRYERVEGAPTDSLKDLTKSLVTQYGPDGIEFASRLVNLLAAREDGQYDLVEAARMEHAVEAGKREAEGGGEGGVPPERWSIERPFDHAEYLKRPVPVYEDRPYIAGEEPVSESEA